MTREEAKQLLPVIQAFADGKTIEFLNARNMWEELEDVLFCREPKYYRIKPETKYRPFKTKEECWNEMMKHHPFGWLKSKKDGRYRCIGKVVWSEAFETANIALSTSESLSRCCESVFEEYTFADGAPFGVME